jgi:sarcosine oxidase subunit beta
VRQIEQVPESADVVIIGGGIVGCASAFFLARSGRQPVVLEQMKAIASATTSVSAHAIRCQFAEAENIAQTTESLAIYETFREVIGDPAAQIDLTQNGYLFASTDQDDIPLFRDRVARQQALGVSDVELLTGDDIRYRFPWMSEEITVGTFRQRDGWIDSVLAATHFLAASGAPVALDTAVTAIEVSGGRVTGVMTNRGRIATETVVLAGGPFSRDISPEPLPLARWRRHRIVLDADERIPQDAPMTIDANTGAHWRPHAGGALMAWAQPETDRAATWPVERDPTWPDLILRSDRGIARLCPFWNEITPGLAPDDYLFTAGLYTVTPDH